MSEKLYLECYSGISGDMTVAALLDLGADQEILKQALKSLPVDGFDIQISQVSKSGIRACDFNVILKEDNHDHDMDYLHGHNNHVTEDSQHTEPQEHHHKHAPDHCEHHHHHSHRDLSEIIQILTDSNMTDHARELAVHIFNIIADAEATAHGIPKDQVHFHEVGAIDSIVDISAVAVCLDNLGITEVIVPVLYEGCGTIRCQHGILPVPVPAVANIANAYHLNLHITHVQGELVTPTGAAIVAGICTGTVLPEHFHIKKTGIGAGKRTYNGSNLLRAFLVEG